jgi:hypothetical protein
MFDHFGHYGQAFELAFFSNLINLVVVGLLVARQHRTRLRPAFG